MKQLQRTKTSLEWLAEKMPEKFRYHKENEYNWYFLLFKYREAIRVKNGVITIYPDDKKQFSTSIGRIFWEAWGELLCITRISSKEFLWDTDSWKTEQDKYIPLESTEELSAMLEALNLRIEQEREK
jgi:hypothetical protein